MEIPHSQLSKEVLDAVIEEFITREGTDYGDRIVSLDDKVEQVRGQLDRGDVFLSFDPLSQSCQLFPREFRAALQSLDEEENY
tara:strand:- start:1194 stop:1442 length:249 start_codon:yes stop_codon:yes gene_type:complete